MRNGAARMCCVSPYWFFAPTFHNAKCGRRSGHWCTDHALPAMALSRAHRPSVALVLRWLPTPWPLALSRAHRPSVALVLRWLPTPWPPCGYPAMRRSERFALWEFARAGTILAKAISVPIGSLARFLLGVIANVSAHSLSPRSRMPVCLYADTRIYCPVVAVQYVSVRSLGVVHRTMLASAHSALLAC